jgi:hypothetical protein
MYSLLLPWRTAHKYGFRPTRAPGPLLLVNSHTMVTQNGVLKVDWAGAVFDVPTRVYGDSSPVFSRYYDPRPPFGIDGYVGTQFFQQDEKLTIDFTQGNPSLVISV